MPAVAGPLDERRITGHTRIMTLLADPVRHVVGTETITAFLRARGIDLVCVPVHVGPADLAGFLQTLRTLRNVVGSGVTIPHKVAAAGLMDSLTPQAAMIGSVNYIRRDDDGSLHGDNVDGAGFVHGARQNGIDPAGLRVLQYGAGGAGRSIAFALAEAGVAELVIVNRDRDRADRLAVAVAAAFPEVRTLVGNGFKKDCDMVVNTTSVGMEADRSAPFDLSLLRPDMIVAEIILNPARTPLLAAASALGCRTLAGCGMLDGQMALAARFLGFGPEQAS